MGVLFLALGCGNSEPAKPWPPVVGQRYPDLTVQALDGSQFQLARLAGKPVLIELVGMTCVGCQAFLGGNNKGIGGFGGKQPQADLSAVDEYLKQYARGLTKGDARYTSVILILYGMDEGAPTLAEAKKFAEHFALTTVAHQLVLIGDARYIRDDSRSLIPGFHLLDREFILRSDAAGIHAPHHYWDHSFPLLATLVGQ